MIDKIVYICVEDNSEDIIFELLTSSPDYIFDVVELFFWDGKEEICFNNRIDQLEGFCKNNGFTYHKNEYVIGTAQEDQIVLIDWNE